jgi:hypothetical protein
MLMHGSAGRSFLHGKTCRASVGRAGAAAADLVHADQVCRFERVGVHEAHDGQEDGLPRGRLQHDALAAALAVQVHVGAVLLLVLLRLHVQDLHHIAHQVGQLVVQLDLVLVLRHL